MLTKKGLLPPLDYLLAFEAVAQSESFAGASRALNVSETAIARKVRLLEQHYEVEFFIRKHRSIRLNQQGRALLDRLTPVLGELREISREMHAERQSSTVTLAATNSVAALWLMPRLPLFNQANSHITIRLLASDVDDECLAEDVDLAILRGDGHWPGFRAQLLFGETVFPVCSPRFLEMNGPVQDIEDLLHQALIGVSSPHTEWMNWQTWLTRSEVSAPIAHQPVQFNTYPLAIQAATEGLGIALGWGHLVDHLLESGDLIRPFGARHVRTQDGYYLLEREGLEEFAHRACVRDWLLDASARRKRYDPGG